MKAVVVRGSSAGFEDRPRPRAAAGEIVVRTTVAALCTGDAQILSGAYPVPAGTVLGHEAVGVVHECGEGVRTVKVGDRVVAAATTPCGRCPECQRGIGGHCGGVAWGGYSSSLSRDGNLAEYFKVPAADLNVALIPDGVPDELAVFVPDTLLTSTTSFEVAGLPLGGTVVVFGQGHIGLGAILAARAGGAGAVIAVKASSRNTALSKTVGADHVLTLQEDDVVAAILELTGGVGVDRAVEASGQASAFPMAIAATRLGGAICVLSTYMDSELRIELEHWGWGVGDKNIVSSYVRGGSEKITRLLRLLESGRIDPRPLITRTYSFHDALDALTDLRDRGTAPVKPLILF